MAEQTLEEYRRAREAEWGTYVALKAIHINGARAFNAGDPVPASHVGRSVPSDAVAKTTTKAAAAVIEKG